MRNVEVENGEVEAQLSEALPNLNSPSYINSGISPRNITVPSAEPTENRGQTGGIQKGTR